MQYGNVFAQKHFFFKNLSCVSLKPFNLAANTDSKINLASRRVTFSLLPSLRTLLRSCGGWVCVSHF